MRAALASCAMLLALAPSVARAHGRPPRIVAIALDPSDPSHIVLSATFGLIATRDGGATWRWSCAASFGADPTQEDPDLVVTGEGSVVVTTFDGVARSDAALCDYSFPAGIARDVFVVDVALDPSDPAAVWGLASSGVEPDQVVRSTDAGRTWSAVGAPMDAILTERVLVAPSDPSRVYVSGAIPPAGDVMRQAFLLRSDDGGEHFEQTEIELVNGERLPHVVGVDPTNADRVFVRMVRGDFDPRNERLLYSEDGGRTFSAVLELPSIHGFAIADDGRTVWAGSSTGGLWIARDGDVSFEQVNDLDVRCLASRGDTLFVCADQITAGFALGRSTDGGAVIDGIFRFQDGQELVECPRCSTSGIVCPAWIPDLRADLATYFGGADAGPPTGLPRDAGVPPECASADGGIDEEPPPPTGCGCRIGARSEAPAWLALALIALAFTRRGSRSADRSGTPRR